MEAGATTSRAERPVVGVSSRSGNRRLECRIVVEKAAISHPHLLACWGLGESPDHRSVRAKGNRGSY